MPHPLDFDAVKGLLPQHTASWPDCRKAGPKTRYAIQDAALGAFGIFVTPSPSFLEYQRRLQHTHGNHNVQTLLGVAPMPCDNQGRPLLAPIAPSRLAPGLLEGFERLA